MFGALQLGLSLTRGNGGGMPWYPHRLFQSGDILLWYDPSDLTTMFKDTAGTQPVTADGDSVALMLDKGQWGGKTLAQVLAAQPELLTNTGFDSDTVWVKGIGWTIASGQLSHVAGSATLTYQTVSLTSGKAYKAACDVNAVSGGTGSLQFRSGGTTTSRTISSADIGTRVELIYVADGNTQIAVFAGSATNITVDNVSVKEIPGYHRVQATGTSMPKYKTGSTLHWLLYDGTDDGNVTRAITWGTDEVAACVGITKLSDAATAVIAETSTSPASTTGAWGMYIRLAAVGDYGVIARGSAFTQVSTGASSFPSPRSDVLTLTADISTDSTSLRVSGAESTSAGDLGTGNFGSYPLYFGRRGGSSIPFNGREYQAVIRSRLLSAAELSALETFVAAKTGVIL